MMHDAHPSDITIGEVWRGMNEIKGEVTKLTDEMKALPEKLASELDAKATQRTEVLRAETILRLQPLELRVGRLERVLYGVTTFVFLGVGGAILALVLRK